MPRTHTLLVLVGLALAAAGCTNDFSVPTGAKVDCASTDDCPEGWKCNPNLKRCVLTDDTTAPSVVGGEVKVEPLVLRQGARAVVSFEVDEELAQPPEVTVKLAQKQVPLVLDEAASQGLKYVFTYTAVGPGSDEPQGVDCPVAVVLTDASGNRSGNASSKSIRFDFVAPSIVKPKPDLVGVAGSPARRDRAVTISFTASEALTLKDPVVTVGGKPAVKDPASLGQSYVYTYAVAPADAEGPAAIAVELEDDAGNATRVDAAGEATFDFTAPSISGLAASPAWAPRNQLVEVVFKASEALARDPQVLLGALPMDRSSRSDPPNYVFTALADSHDGEAMKASVSLEDLAGNTFADPDGPTVEFDFTAPTLLTHSLPAAPVRAGGSAYVRFETSEPLDPSEGQVRVHVGSAEAACAPQPARTSFDCVLDVPAVPDPALEGEQLVSVELHDHAGNGGSVVLERVTFDFTPPGLTIAATPAGRAAREGEVAIVTVTSDEPIAGDAVKLAFSPDPGAIAFGAPPAQPVRNTFQWTHVVTAAEEGSFAVTATASDAAGNPGATPASATAAIDGKPPGLLDPALTPPSAMKNTHFEFSFKASEALGALPEVSYSNTVDPRVWMTLKSGPTAEPPGFRYVFESTTPAIGQAPFYLVKAVLKDVAGNTLTWSDITLEVDNTPPKLANFKVAPTFAKLGDRVRVVVSATETLGRAPVIRARAQAPGTTVIDFVAEDAAAGQISYSYSADVQASTPSGKYDFDPFDLEDVAGNVTATPQDPPAEFQVLDVDSIPPVISNLDVSPARASRVGGYEWITIAFDASEAIPQPIAQRPAESNLDVSIGPRWLDPAKDCAPPTGTGPFHYACVTAVGAADPEGSSVVRVSIADAAGNRDEASSVVALDFTPPRIEVVAVAPTRPGQGASISYAVYADEALDPDPGNAPVLTVDKVADWGDPKIWGSTAVWFHRVPTDSSEDGVHAATLTNLCDEVGNCTKGGLPSDPVVIDAVLPAIAGTPTIHIDDDTYPRARSGARVSVSFDVSEPLSTPPTVMLGSVQTDPCAPAGATRYTCARTVSQTGDAEGMARLVALLTDASLNAASADLGPVHLDFTPPAVQSGRVELVPDPAKNPLSVVTAVTNGTAVRARVWLSEPLAPGSPDPVAAVDLAPDQVLPLSAKDPTRQQFDFNTGASPTPITGLDADLIEDHVVSITNAVVDLAGNAAVPPLQVASLEVDTEAPASPATGALDAVIYRRVPWGRSAAARTSVTDPPPAPQFTLRAAAGAFPAASYYVAVHANATDPTNASLLALAPLNAAKGFDEFAMESATDRTTLYVAAVDDAGNQSAPAEVRDVEWVATLAGKQPYDPVVNPHRFVETAILSPTLDQAAGAERDGDGIEALDANPVNESDGREVAYMWSAVTWTPWNAQARPAQRIGAAMAYDPVRGRTVLFGGELTNGFRSDETWEWNGVAWSLVCGGTTGCQGPVARKGAALAYDARRGTLQLFGGESDVDTACYCNDCGGPDPMCNDLWEWDGTHWAAVTPAGIPPLTRRGHAMAYDANRGRLVVVGGAADGNYVLRDTWEFDGDRWWQVDPGVASSPAARLQHAMAYDAVRGNVLLFGGCTSQATYGQCDGSVLSDTWTWNGLAWSQKAPGTVPPARCGHAMAYDSGRVVGTTVTPRPVIFGGQNNLVNLTDTYEWTGTTWASRAPTTSPPDRREHAMAYDSARKKVVVFGGETGDEDMGGTSTYQDTWELDGVAGSSWTAAALVDEIPIARYGAVMAWDAARKNLVTFGGSSDASTYVWNGGGWRKAATTGPTARSGHAMAYHPSRGVVMFGGVAGNETWEWNGASWANRGALVPAPAARVGHAMVYDAAANVILLWGGKAYGSTTLSPGNEVWEYGAAGTWTLRTLSGTTPLARQQHAMAYDQSRPNVTMMRGGVTATGFAALSTQTWEYNSSTRTWTDRTVSGDGYFARGGMAYEEARRKVVLFGGATSAVNYSNSLMEWTGTRWSPGLQGTYSSHLPAVAPAAREQFAMAYDPVRGRTVVFGGTSPATNILGDTWLYDGAAGSRPGQVMSVDFEASGALADTASYGAPLVKRLRAWWSGSGRGYDPATGAQVDGAALLLWENGGWTTVGSNTAALTQPAWLTAATPFEVTDPTRLAQALVGPARTVAFAAQPKQANNSGAIAADAVARPPARVLTDYAEVELAYRTCLKSAEQKAVPANVSTVVLTGNTCDGCDRRTPGCAAGPSPEVRYELQLPAGASRSIDARVTGFDSVLYLRHFPDGPQADLACNDNSTPPGGVGSRITASALQGGATGDTYYLFVDGSGTACGAYTLTLTITSP